MNSNRLLAVTAWMLMNFPLFSGCVSGIKGVSAEALEAAAAINSTPVSRRLSETYSLANTLTGLSLKANFAAMDGVGTVYYAVYDSDPGTMTPDAVKTAAGSAVAGSLVARGTLAVPAAATDYTVSVNGLAEKKLYTVFAVAEDGSGLAAASKVKKITGVIPKSMTQLNWAKVGAPAIGTTVRYMVHLPAGYYDNPTVSYPLVVWLHGNGESTNDAGNPESGFAIMSYAGFFKKIYGGFDDIPAIIVAAQCNYAFFNCSYQQEYTLHREVIDQAIANFRVNQKRIYATGISYGASGAFTLASHYPTLIAAVMVTSGIPLESTATLCASLGANNVPVWGLMNHHDTFFSNATLQAAISALRGCTALPAAKSRVTIFETGTWPNTIELHGSGENLALGLPYYNGASWRYWNGAAEVADTNPPSHLTAPPVELTTAAPTMTPDAPSIQSDSFVSVAAELGFPVAKATDWLLHFSKP